MKYIIIVGIFFLSITYAISVTSDIVFDVKTRLEWQNELSNKTDTMTFFESINYCENLTLDNKDDWRLPNINELKSLIDYNATNPLIISSLAETTGMDYWSSTTKFGSSEGYVVDFSNGLVAYRNKIFEKNIRCVRDK